MAPKQGMSFFQVSCGGCENWGWCRVSHILVCVYSRLLPLSVCDRDNWSGLGF